MSDLVTTWRMSNEANLYLLAKLPRDGLAARYDARTRTVAAQFAHVHGVRLRWLAHAAPRLKGKVPPFPKGAEPTKAELKRALADSEKTVARFLEECEAAGVVPGWNGPPASFLGYLVAHEAHHRGLALVALRAAGHRLPQELVYGLWDWGKRRSLR